MPESLVAVPFCRLFLFCGCGVFWPGIYSTSALSIRCSVARCLLMRSLRWRPFISPAGRRGAKPQKIRLLRAGHSAAGNNKNKKGQPLRGKFCSSCPYGWPVVTFGRYILEIDELPFWKRINQPLCVARPPFDENDTIVLFSAEKQFVLPRLSMSPLFKPFSLFLSGLYGRCAWFVSY